MRISKNQFSNEFFSLNFSFDCRKECVRFYIIIKKIDNGDITQVQDQRGVTSGAMIRKRRP